MTPRRPGHIGHDGVALLMLWQQSTGTFPAERTLREREVTFHHDDVVRHGEDGSSGGIFFTDPDSIRVEIVTSSGVPAQAAGTGEPACGFF